MQDLKPFQESISYLKEIIDFISQTPPSLNAVFGFSLIATAIITVWLYLNFIFKKISSRNNLATFTTNGFKPINSTALQIGISRKLLKNMPISAGDKVTIESGNIKINNVIVIAKNETKHFKYYNIEISDTLLNQLNGNDYLKVFNPTHHFSFFRTTAVFISSEPFTTILGLLSIGISIYQLW